MICYESNKAYKLVDQVQIYNWGLLQEFYTLSKLQQYFYVST